MRIAFLNQPMDGIVPPHQNSTGLWTWGVAPRLAGRGHDVTAIGRRGWMHDGVGDQLDGVDLRFVSGVVPNRRVIAGLDRIPGPRRLPGYASSAAYADYASLAAITARRQRAEIVHIHNFSQFVPVVRRLHPRAKIVLHMSGEWLSQLDRSTMRQRIRQSDLIAACSSHLTAQIVRRFPDEANRCVTIDNGVDLGRFRRSDRPSTGPPRLLFVGRVSPEKGVHDLIDAFVLAANTIPDLCLDIVGDLATLPQSYIIEQSTNDDIAELARFYESDYHDHLRSKIPPALADRVVFHGGVAQDQLVDFYRSADLLVNPSYVESFGMSLIEAAACGTPVVATRVGGMPSVVGDDGEMGVLVDGGDVDGLAGALVELMLDPRRRAGMAAEGERRVTERFSWDSVATAVEQAHTRLVES